MVERKHSKNNISFFLRFSPFHSWLCELPLQQTETAKERLGLQHQKRIKAVNQILQKQELERNQLLQQVNETDTETQDEINTLESMKIEPESSRNYSHNKLLDLNFQFLLHSFFMI